MEKINELTQQVLHYACKVHSASGPGLPESSYQQCLYYELNRNGIYTGKEKPMPLYYEDVKTDIGYRVDLMVENKIIIEIKCAECFTDVHTAQLLTYLKLSGCKIEFLLNFKTASLQNGIKRYIL